MSPGYRSERTGHSGKIGKAGRKWPESPKGGGNAFESLEPALWLVLSVRQVIVRNKQLSPRCKPREWRFPRTCSKCIVVIQPP